MGRNWPWLVLAFIGALVLAGLWAFDRFKTAPPAVTASGSAPIVAPAAALEAPAPEQPGKQAPLVDSTRFVRDDRLEAVVATNPSSAELLEPLTEPAQAPEAAPTEAAPTLPTPQPQPQSQPDWREKLRAFNPPPKSKFFSEKAETSAFIAAPKPWVPDPPRPAARQAAPAAKPTQEQLLAAMRKSASQPRYQDKYQWTAQSTHRSGPESLQQTAAVVAGPPAPGQPARVPGRGRTLFQGISLPTLDGSRSVALDSCPTARCLTIYVAPWCTYCRQAEGLINEMRQSLASRGVTTRVVVERDTDAAVREYARNFGGATLLDSAGIGWRGGVPAFILTDSQGRTIRILQGAPSSAGAGVAWALGD